MGELLLCFGYGRRFLNPGLSLTKLVNPVDDGIRQHDRGDNLQRKRHPTLHGNNRNDRKADVDDGNQKARRARDLQPPRRAHAKSFHADERYGKQNEVSQRVENSAGVVE